MLGAEFRDESLASDVLARRVTDAKGPDVIALESMRQAREAKQGAVITGFRLVEELEAVRAGFPYARIIWIEASERTRFERGLKRGRLEDSRALAEFRAKAKTQEGFGLLDVADELVDGILVNEDDLAGYLRQIDQILAGPGPSQGLVAPRLPNSERSQLLRGLRILERVGRPMTCEEIAASAEAEGNRIRANNANKILKRCPALAHRFDSDLARVRYEITDAGRSYLRLVDQRSLAKKAIHLGLD